jgi:hypothetical protein
MVVDELVILVEEMEHGLKAHSRRLDQGRIDSVTSPDPELGRRAFGIIYVRSEDHRLKAIEASHHGRKCPAQLQSRRYS